MLPFLASSSPIPRRRIQAPGPRSQPLTSVGTYTCKRCQKKTPNIRFEEALLTCPHCGFHAPVRARQRLELIADPGTLEIIELPLTLDDPLGFDDGIPYRDRHLQAQEKTGLTDTFCIGKGELAGKTVVLAAMEFQFFGGSLGKVAGDSFLIACRRAVEDSSPLIAVCTSGGARMQEGIVSLAQMARCTAGVQSLSDCGLPFITVLADPCYGGVTASFATQGDVILAEPQARIGFAGGRVIEQATYDKLPHGFQTAEFLLSHGMLDAVVDRRELTRTLALLVEAFSTAGASR